jgi:hypothetical protein
VPGIATMTGGLVRLSVRMMECMTGVMLNMAPGEKGYHQERVFQICHGDEVSS